MPTFWLEAATMETLAAVLFGAALVHTFAAGYFEKLAVRKPRHAGLLHLLGEVEVVFGLWAFVLIVFMALILGTDAAIAYAESRQFTEPLFVFSVMVIAASRPVLDTVRQAMGAMARLMPLRLPLAMAWLALALVPLLGSLITEPAAMTLAALMLAPQVFTRAMPEHLKYAALGVLFVNISIGGTLTAYAAPPVLMVSGTWGWDSAFMASTFGWKAVIAVVVNATALVYMLRSHLIELPPTSRSHMDRPTVPWPVRVIHLAFLGGVVSLGHHPVLFLGIFLIFLGYAHAYARYQDPLLLKESLLVGFFLAGLVVLGGMQQWWLQPIVSNLTPDALFFGALTLTAITDNAALTYLGSQIEGISDAAKYMLVAGAVAGGGLTVIANAPNPAGVALLRSGFADNAIGAGRLLMGALAPTLVAASAFLLL